MKKNKFINFFIKLSDIITNNIGIIITITLLTSIIFMMYQKGFKINVDMMVTPQESAVLIEDRVPALAVYYQRERVPVTIVLAVEEDLEEGEILEDINLQVRYNANRLFESYIPNKIPVRENFVFTHFSLEPDGEPLDPGIRVTEELTIYANWKAKPKVQPYQVLARINNQIEVGRRRYATYFYTYKVINKGMTTDHTLDAVDGLTRPEGYVVKLRVSGTETQTVLDYAFGFNRDDTYSLQYNLNGGALLVQTQQTNFNIPINGSVSEAPGVKKDGHRFIGWSRSDDGDIVPLEDISITSNIVLYAIFQPSIDKPSDSSGMGRYLTTYFIEPINPNAPFTQFTVMDNIAEINSEIEAVPLELEHFETIRYGDITHREIIFGGQFLIVSKKDKMALLNNKILAYTEVYPVGIVLLVLIFGTLVWTFVDSKPNVYKYLILALLLTTISVLIFVLPSTVKFSNYFKNIWDISMEMNPQNTSIQIMNGLKISGTLAAIGALFTYFVLIVSASKLIIKKKKDKAEEILEEQ